MVRDETHTMFCNISTYSSCPQGTMHIFKLLLLRYTLVLYGLYNAIASWWNSPHNTDNRYDT